MSAGAHDPIHRKVIVIGSGFGGAMAAWALVREGHDVLMLERGPWVARGPHNWEPEGTINRTPYYTGGARFLADTGRGSREASACSCVGGPSVFYGGVSLRYRERDFLPDPEIVADSGARWPITYHDLAPFYDEAERILHVAGSDGDDPTGPPRKDGFPEMPGDLSEVSRAMEGAARSLGLRPFRLPLAINYRNGGANPACVACDTCDTFACRIEAKNDLSVRVIPLLVQRGMDLRVDMAVTALRMEGRRLAAVECAHRTTGERHTFTADAVVLAAGALGSAHILLASGLQEHNPAGDSVGRYLTRHCSGIVFGAIPWIKRYEGRFHKQIGINDYYFGDPDGGGPPGKLGNIQQTQTPSMGTVAGEVGQAAALALAPLVRRSTGLLVMAEDRPRYENRVDIEPGLTDELGLPRLVVRCHYGDRDLEARAFLAGRAKRIHRAAGALATYFHKIDTFSHALGSVRMGNDPERDPVGPDGRFRGVENLYLSDGSTLPTSAGVNPSLTIAANALRIGGIVAEVLRSDTNS